MFRKISERIVDKLFKEGAIKEEEKDFYYYGIEVALSIMANIITTIAIGSIFNMVIESALFLLIYIPLRSYAGGYHASNEVRCYILSGLVNAGVLMFVKYIPKALDMPFALMGLILSVPVILLLAPVQDGNKVLDKKEKNFFKKRIRNILGLYIFITILCISLNLNSIAVIIVSSIFILQVILAIGIFNNYYKYKAKQERM